MAFTEQKRNEDVNSMLRRFRKQVEKEGIIKETRERQYFVKPSQKKHEKIRRMARRRERELAAQKEEQQYQGR